VCVCLCGCVLVCLCVCVCCVCVCVCVVCVCVCVCVCVVCVCTELIVPECPHRVRINEPVSRCHRNTYTYAPYMSLKRQIGPKVPWTSGQSRSKVDSRKGHVSGERMTITFLKTAPTAKICSPTIQIQKLVRFAHSKRAICSVYT